MSEFRQISGVNQVVVIRKNKTWCIKSPEANFPEIKHKRKNRSALYSLIGVFIFQPAFCLATITSTTDCTVDRESADYVQSAHGVTELALSHGHRITLAQ